jgi:predicted metalloenzyme YecM
MRRAHERTARRVDADLLVELKVSQRQLDRLANLLLLHVETADIRVAHVRLLVHLHHLDRRVSLGRQNLHHCRRVTVQRL